MTDTELRLVALQLAQQTFGATGAPALVLAAAANYVAFLKGDPNAS